MGWREALDRGGVDRLRRERGRESIKSEGKNGMESVGCQKNTLANEATENINTQIDIYRKKYMHNT